jgi:hypothetical protein
MKTELNGRCRRVAAPSRRWLVAVALFVGLAGCAGHDPLVDGGGTEDFEIRNLEARARCYQDNSFDWSLKALIYSPSGSSGRVTRWAFRLVREGATIGTVDESSYASYGLHAAVLQPEIGVSSAIVHLEAQNTQPTQYFCGVGADNVVFECTLRSGTASEITLSLESPFVFATN